MCTSTCIQIIQFLLSYSMYMYMNTLIPHVHEIKNTTHPLNTVIHIQTEQCTISACSVHVLYVHVSTCTCKYNCTIH